MNRAVWCLVGILILSLGCNGWLFYKNDKLNTVVSLVNQKEGLHQQQMNEYMMIMYSKTNENIAEVARQQGKLEGMLSVIHNIKPDANEHSAVWHAGYHRGLDQSKDMKTTDTEYATDREKKKK